MNLRRGRPAPRKPPMKERRKQRSKKLAGDTLHAQFETRDRRAGLPTLPETKANDKRTISRKASNRRSHAAAARETRSAIMRAVSSENTTPEVTVRRLLHSLGYRYRLHVRGLPGTPDIVFASRKKTVFINGCFWHGHDCARGARVPKSNAEYWIAKIARNRARDGKTRARLRTSGWAVLVVWECELRDKTRLVKRLSRFLSGSQSHS